VPNRNPLQRYGWLDCWALKCNGQAMRARGCTARFLDLLPVSSICAEMQIEVHPSPRREHERIHLSESRTPISRTDHR
jgi:hypothetical protein